MNSPERTPTTFRKPLLLAAICFVALTAALPLFIAYGQSRHGADGLQVALIAYGICLTAALAALTIAGLCNSPQLAVAGVMGSMLIRMGMPMAAIVLFQATKHPLLDAGLNGTIVAYYLLMLAIEAPLSVLLVRSNPSPTGAS